MKKLTKKDKENIDTILKLATGELILIKTGKDKYIMRKQTDYEKQDKPIGMPNLTEWLNRKIKREEIKNG